jgi:hypothetical protein
VGGVEVVDYPGRMADTGAKRQYWIVPSGVLGVDREQFEPLAGRRKHEGNTPGTPAAASCVSPSASRYHATLRSRSETGKPTWWIRDGCIQPPSRGADVGLK